MVAKNKLTTPGDTLLYVGLQVGSFFIAKMVATHLKQSNKKEDKEKKNKINTIHILLECVGVRVFRQCLWKIALNRYHMGSFSFIWAAFDVFQDCLTLYLASKGDYNKWTMMKQIGAYLFMFGSLMETSHDILRNLWISYPENKGKVYQQGWSKFIVYPNYCGYWLWNTGRSLITGNIIFAASISIFHFYNFQSHSIARAHLFSLEKYGKEYQDYIAKTPKMIPFIF